MSLYKQSSVADEIAFEMEKALKLNKLENKYAVSKLASAVDHLNTAAELFDATGYTGEAEVITRLLERLAQKREHLPAEHSDFTLTSKEREFFDKLPEHHKSSLKTVDFKEFPKAVRDLMTKQEVGRMNEAKPEVIEFESLLGRGKQLPSSDRLDDIITFEDLQADDEKSHSEMANPIRQNLDYSVANVLDSIRTGKKKAR